VTLERQDTAPDTGLAFDAERDSRRCVVKELFLVLFSVTLLGSVAIAGQSKHQSLQGAWQTVEIAMTGPGARTIAIPEPRANLIVFTARHYSQLHLDAEGPRPALADATTASADQLRAVWGPFAGDAGSYEVHDGVITMRPVVARSPSAMAPGAFTTYAYRLDGNTLWVTFQKNQDGPIVNPVTIKAVRVE
jgi:hypothetical protein